MSYPMLNEKNIIINILEKYKQDIENDNWESIFSDLTEEVKKYGKVIIGDDEDYYSSLSILLWFLRSQGYDPVKLADGFTLGMSKSDLDYAFEQSTEDVASDTFCYTSLLDALNSTIAWSDKVLTAFSAKQCGYKVYVQFSKPGLLSDQPTDGFDFIVLKKDPNVSLQSVMDKLDELGYPQPRSTFKEL